MSIRTSVLLIVVLAIGLVAIASGSHPSFSDQSGQCCSGPAPEDIRAYGVTMAGGEPVVIIPEVEGVHGFMLTDTFSGGSSVRLFQDTGDGPVEILYAGSVFSHRLSPVPGFPLILGSTITVLGSQDDRATIIGYVY